MKNIKALSISTILTIILIVFMTIYSELNKPFKNFLKSLAGHHWVAKGIISLVFFVLAYYTINQFVSKKENVKNSVTWVIVFTILGGLAIFLFYVYEFFA